MTRTQHDARDRHTGRYKATIRCDFCGGAIGNNTYCSDDEVCAGSDGPGFYLCGRTRCETARRGLSVATRRALYTAQRAVNEGKLPPLPLVFRVHDVLAGAYLGGKRAAPAHTLTHAAVGDDLTAICGRVRPDMLCDLERGDDVMPTCPECARHMTRLIEP